MKLDTKTAQDDSSTLAKVELQDLIKQSLATVIMDKLIRINPQDAYQHWKSQTLLSQHSILRSEDIPWNETILDDLRSQYFAGQRFKLLSPFQERITKDLVNPLQIFHEFQHQEQFVVKPKPTTIKSIIKAMRPHQWSKNCLIFLPIFFHLQSLSVTHVFQAIFSFISMCLCASGVYLINDWMDLSDDRHHPAKKNRPMAAGDLNPLLGLSLAPFLLLSGLTLSASLHMTSFLLVLGYVFLTSAYTFILKRIPFIDITTLTTLYIMRILYGNLAFETSFPIWGWLSAACGFYSLAFCKRYTELKSRASSRRGYHLEDQPWIGAYGMGLSWVCIIFLLIPLSLQEDQPFLLWIGLFIFWHWFARMWIITIRQKMPEDPVSFALKDKVSMLLITGAAISVLVHQVL